MITHIVLFQLDDKLAGEEKDLHLAALKSDFEQLPHTIKELVDLRIEINANHSEKYDLALIAHCEALQKLHDYATHPDHVALVGKYIKPYLVSRACVDYRD